MRYSQSEKMQVIRLVEESPVSVKQTLFELNINRSTFYTWYRRYQQGGYEALANRYRPPKQFWNQIPPWERLRVVEIALEHPQKSPRELAWYITDKRGYYISESTVYRILKAHDLVTSPVYYYLCTILDDYSRYILAWQLCTGMSTEEVKQTIEAAIEFSGVDDPNVWHFSGCCQITAPAMFLKLWGNILRPKVSPIPAANRITP
jgi:transposase InsO family protein